MPAIERYVAKVRFWLPGEQGRQVEAELRETLTELVGEEAQARGRALDAAEVAQLLKAFGHPAVVASRYASELPLVSAGLMPAFRRVLVISLAGVLVAQATLVLYGLSSDPASFGDILRERTGALVHGVLWSFTSIALVFAVLTRIYAKAAQDSC